MVPPCRRAPAGSVLLPVRSSVGFDAGRCSDRGAVAGRYPLLVDSRFPSPVELSPPGQSRWWCRGSPLECYRSTGGLSSSFGSAFSLYRSSVSPVGLGRLFNWPVVSRRRRRWWCSVGSGCWSLLACRRSLFIASHPLSPAPLSEGSIHYHILDSLRLVRLPSPPLSPPVSWLRPESFATRLSTELHLP